MLKYKN